ncbi:hypothetical protein BRC81_16410 [Halobacteriales archaeon QS_1_68_20]|nr:MAG: hypothetical protein BRC81_16410 [Halobacteriales archaeon QS_1_68_20]
MGATRDDRSLVGDLFVDLKRFHEHWMGLVYPRQVGAEGTVLGKWKPTTTRGIYAYRLWGLLGALVVALTYPLVLLGVVVRFQVRRIDAGATRIGLLGVVLLSVLAWGGLALLARARFPFEGFLAVVAAGGVATASAVLAVLFARIDGRFTTVVLAYPFGVTAVFLPPVAAALYSPTLANVVFPSSESLAIWILSNVFEPLGVREAIHAYFELVGYAYVLMWFAIAVPVGWTLGVLVTLADVVRPTGN